VDPAVPPEAGAGQPDAAPAAGILGGALAMMFAGPGIFALDRFLPFGPDSESVAPAPGRR
jgi:hypothetical protein